MNGHCCSFRLFPRSRRRGHLIVSALISIAAACSIVAGPLAQAQQPQPGVANDATVAAAATAAKRAIQTPGTCRGKGLGVRPRGIRFTCVRDAHFGGQKLRWRKWGGRQACRGRLRLLRLAGDSEPPALVEGTTHSEPSACSSEQTHLHTTQSHRERTRVLGRESLSGRLPGEQFQAVYRETEGVPAPCVFQ